MADKFFDNKSSRKNKIKQDQLDKNKYNDEDKKIQHKQKIEHKKHKEEFEEDEWEYWKEYYK